MTVTLFRAIGVVKSVDTERDDVSEISVEINGETYKAIAYRSLTGPVGVGERVILNTTAVSKALGTGGFHFVMGMPDRPDMINEPVPGHIMKARYTPCQSAVLSVEEEDSPYRHAIDSFQSLFGMPIVVGQLHSQSAPAIAAVKRLTYGKAKVAYIMTDSASLPISFSKLVHSMKEKSLIDCSITYGQAFGGDIEAINIYTALIAAKEVAKADVAVVCPGPGNAGTGTMYGFSSIEQGEIINAVNVLGGTAIGIIRVSFSDQRPRHQGISHHSITSLEKIALTKAYLALPMIDQMKLMILQEQIAHSAIAGKHTVRIMDGSSGIRELQDRGITMSTMGRSYEQDSEFFLSASASGALAVESLKAAGKF